MPDTETSSTEVPWKIRLGCWAVCRLIRMAGFTWRTTWEGLGTGADDTIFGSIVYEEGGIQKLAIGGSFTSVDGLTASRVAWVMSIVSTKPGSTLTANSHESSWMALLFPVSTVVGL